jgi:hypothetical protein
MPRIRAGDADRERHTEWVSLAYEKGYLTLEELHERTDQVLAARYMGDLSAPVRELPTLAELRPKPKPVPTAQVSRDTSPVDLGFILGTAVVGTMITILILVGLTVLNSHAAAAHARQVQQQQQQQQQEARNYWSRQKEINQLAQQWAAQEGR